MWDLPVGFQTKGPGAPCSGRLPVVVFPAAAGERGAARFCGVAGLFLVGGGGRRKTWRGVWPALWPPELWNIPAGAVTSVPASYF